MIDYGMIHTHGESSQTRAADSGGSWAGVVRSYNEHAYTCNSMSAVCEVYLFTNNEVTMPSIS